jgi:hypothetical protein
MSAPVGTDGGAARPGAPPPFGASPHPGEPSRAARLIGLLPVILLAALGLMAALVAWRVAIAGSAASDADRAALTAARALSAETIEAEALVARTTEAWLDYERNRRRAEALEAAGFPADALRYRKEATTHWFLVRPEYLGEGEVYESDEHRAAVLEEASASEDLDPGPHLVAADREYRRVDQLLLAAVILGIALPPATFAELTHGRARVVSGLLAAGILAVGVGILALAWA